MTQAGADSRANYLLKWEAIRELARAGRDELRPVGPRPRRDRPLQDGLRRAARSATSARRTSCSTPLGRRTYAVAQARPGPRRADAPRPARAARRPRRSRGTGAATGATRDGGRVRELAVDELDGWDARGGRRRPGGHVLQSRAWAAHRAASGLAGRGSSSSATPGRSSSCGRGRWSRGGSAYVPRGPGRRTARRGRPRRDGVRRRRVARRARGPPLGRAGIGRARRGPRGRRRRRRLPRARSTASGSTAIPEIQPSRHRMALPLPAGTDEHGRVGRHREGDPPADPARRARRRRRRALGRRRRPSSRARSAPTEDGARRPRPVLRPAPRDRRPARLRVRRARASSLPWWRRALEAGHLVYLEAREGAPDGDVLGGLVLYRHGRRLSTAALRRPRRAAPRPPGRDAPAPLAGDPARARGGPRRRWTSAAWTSPGARRIPTEGEPTLRPVRAQAVVRGRVGGAGRRPGARRAAAGATPLGRAAVAAWSAAWRRGRTAR